MLALIEMLSTLQPPNRIQTKKLGGGLHTTSTNPSTHGITTTPPHPKYQNNNINNK